MVSALVTGEIFERRVLPGETSGLTGVDSVRVGVAVIVVDVVVSAVVAVTLAVLPSASFFSLALVPAWLGASSSSSCKGLMSL